MRGAIVMRTVVGEEGGRGASAAQRDGVGLEARRVPSQALLQLRAPTLLRAALLLRPLRLLPAARACHYAEH